MKSVFVTGGNTGIGEALCRILVRDHGCYVYLGSRNEERGAKAVADIKEQVKFLREYTQFFLLTDSFERTILDTSLILRKINE